MPEPSTRLQLRRGTPLTVRRAQRDGVGKGEWFIS